MDLYWSHEELDAEVRVSSIVMKEQRRKRAKEKTAVSLGKTWPRGHHRSQQTQDQHGKVCYLRGTEADGTEEEERVGGAGAMEMQ